MRFTKEKPNAAGGCLAVGALYVAGMVAGAIAGGFVGLACAWASLTISHPDGEAAGFLPVSDALIGGSSA